MADNGFCALLRQYLQVLTYSQNPLDVRKYLVRLQPLCLNFQCSKWSRPDPCLSLDQTSFYAHSGHRWAPQPFFTRSTFIWLALVVSYGTKELIILNVIKSDQMSLQFWTNRLITGPSVRIDSKRPEKGLRGWAVPIHVVIVCQLKLHLHCLIICHLQMLPYLSDIQSVPKKRTFRMLLEPQCSSTGSITSSWHPLCLEINFLFVSYKD